MKDTLDVLKNRVSLRQYADKPVTSEDFNCIIENAMRAPTAGNMMLYSIIHVKDQDKKEILSHTCDNQPFIAKAPLVLIFTADLQKWYDYYSLNGVENYCRENGKTFTAPSEANLLLASCDAMIAAQNAVIAGEALGIGSCYIGDIMEQYEKHKNLLNLPDFVFPVGMLCMGYYPENYKKKLTPRFNRDYVLFEDEYKRLSSNEINDMFKTYDSRFSEKNLYNAKNYAQTHYAFKIGADFSKEMARSVREALKNWNERIIE